MDADLQSANIRIHSAWTTADNLSSTRQHSSKGTPLKKVITAANLYKNMALHANKPGRETRKRRDLRYWQSIVVNKPHNSLQLADVIPMPLKMAPVRVHHVLLLSHSSTTFAVSKQLYKWML